MTGESSAAAAASLPPLVNATRPSCVKKDGTTGTGSHRDFTPEGVGHTRGWAVEEQFGGIRDQPPKSKKQKRRKMGGGRCVPTKENKKASKTEEDPSKTNLLLQLQLLLFLILLLLLLLLLLLILLLSLVLLSNQDATHVA